jgi:hypothetical protein
LWWSTSSQEESYLPATDVHHKKWRIKTDSQTNISPFFSSEKHEYSNLIAFHHLILPKAVTKCNGTLATHFRMNFTILQEFIYGLMIYKPMF